MKRHFKRGGSRSFSFTAFMGIAISLASLIALSLAASALAFKSENPTSKIGLISTVVLVLSGCVCGIFISKFKGKGGVCCAALTALAFAVILIMSKLIFSGDFSVYSIINAVCYLGSATLCAYLSRPRTAKRRY